MYSPKRQYLYHYTSFESAIKILASQKLLFSAVGTLNDINESSGVDYLSKDITVKEQERFDYLLNSYSQLSFTMDTKNRRGFDIPAMWGHYAERGRGVCFAFDKRMMIKEARKRSLYSKEVNYSPILDLDSLDYDDLRYKDPDSFIRLQKDELFFHKSKDWEYEQEYRFILINDDPNQRYFDITGLLSAIILYAKKYDDFLDSVEFKALYKICRRKIFYHYNTSLISSNLYDIKGHCLTKKSVFFDMSLTSEVSNANE